MIANRDDNLGGGQQPGTTSEPLATRGGGGWVGDRFAEAPGHALSVCTPPIFGVGRPHAPADTRTVRVRYAIGGILAAAVLALPASAPAGQGGQVSSLAAQQCAQERAEIGKKAFHKRYGQKRTMRACARRYRGRVAAALATATQDCQAELSEIGDADFIDEYGDEPTDSVEYAMSECVAEDVDEILNPEDYVDDETDDEE